MAERLLNERRVAKNSKMAGDRHDPAPDPRKTKLAREKPGGADLGSNGGGKPGMLHGLEALRVLIIDDNENMRLIIATMLRGAGVRQIKHAESGQSGLEHLQRTTVDVAFVDFHMTPLDGIDFTRAVRSLQSDARFLPIIMITGHAETARITAARDAGVTEVIVKPVITDSVLDRLSRVICKPRSFIESAGYFGPDRRRHGETTYTGPRRRASDQGQAG